MEVILLKKIDNLGGLGDRVTVKGGYGRNFLVPTGQAVSATSANVAAFEERRAELEKQAAEAVALAESRKGQLEQLSIRIACKAGDEGRLFGSIGTIDVAQAVNEAGVELSRNEVRLPQGALRVIGEYEVDLHLHTDVDAKLRLEIVPE